LKTITSDPNQSLVFVVFFAITALTAGRKVMAVREPPLPFDPELAVARPRDSVI